MFPPLFMHTAIRNLDTRNYLQIPRVNQTNSNLVFKSIDKNENLILHRLSLIDILLSTIL